MDEKFEERLRVLEAELVRTTSVLEAIATIVPVNADDEISQKINEILSKFNQN